MVIYRMFATFRYLETYTVCVRGGTNTLGSEKEGQTSDHVKKVSAKLNALIHSNEKL